MSRRDVDASIIILAYNKSEFTSLCLQSLLSIRDARFEVLVVDNGSTDNTPEILSVFTSAFAGVGQSLRVIRNAENIGAPAGRNQAMIEARGRYIALLDNDIVAGSREWLHDMIQYLERSPETGMVGPKLIYAEPPHRIQCAGAGISKRGKVLFMGRGMDRSDPAFCKKREVQALISACVVLPRSVYERTGDMDTDFSPVQFEDLDYCYRIREQGFRLLVLPDVEMYHWESVTTAGTPELNNPYNVARNSHLFKKKWHHVFQNEDGPAEDDARWQGWDVNQ